MSRMNKFVALAMLAVIVIGTPINSVQADVCCPPENCYVTDAGGWGYETSQDVPSLTPYIILGAALIAVIVAVAVRHHHGNNNHAHCHCD